MNGTGRGFQGAQSFQGPKGMDGGRIQAQCINRRVLHKAQKLRDDILLAAFHQKALGMQTPEFVVMGEALEECVGI